MKSAKQEVVELLDVLPDDVSMDTLLEQMRLKAKLLRSLEYADRGELIPHEEVMEDLHRWLESPGHPRPAGTSKR